MTKCPFGDKINKLSSFHPVYFPVYFLRHWGKWEEHIHQTDEDYPRHWLLRRGQKGFHQTGLSEHLHSHAGNDPSHGDA